MSKPPEIVPHTPDEPASGHYADISWVSPQLAVSGRIDCEHWPVVARTMGVGAVIDVRGETCDDRAALQRAGMRFLHVPTPDFESPPLHTLRAAARWAGRRIAAGQRVLVHCEFGIGRSPLLAACVLVQRGCCAAEALRRIKRVRPKTSPNPQQLQALAEFEALVTHRARDSVQALCGELALIAYAPGD